MKGVELDFSGYESPNWIIFFFYIWINKYNWGVKELSTKIMGNWVYSIKKMLALHKKLRQDKQNTY